MWDNSKSLMLTVWWMRVALVLWGAFVIIMPTLFFQQWVKIDILVLFGIVYIPILIIFYGLHEMLSNIQKGVIFSLQNTACLRLVSWACFFSALFLLVAALRWPVLVLISGVIGFLGLFVRVIKNMLAEAIDIKEENDFTI